MIKSIVVGFDGSDASERALTLACEIAGKFGAEIQVSHTPKDETVVFAAEAISGFYVGPTVAQDDALREVAQKIEARIIEIAKASGQPEIEVHIGHGEPSDDVLARADATQADLIVTGRRGLGDLRGLFLGSTSHSISRRATCACLTVA